LGFGGTTDEGQATSGRTGHDVNQVFSATAGSLNINGTSIDFAAGATLQQVINNVNNSGAGVVIVHDTANSVFRIESRNTGANNTISITDGTTNTANFLGQLGFAMTVNDIGGRTSTAENASITLNGTVHNYMENNNFTIHGLNFSLSEGITAADMNRNLTVNLQRDVEPAINMVKQFVESYNALVTMLNDLTTTVRPRSSQYSFYEPLTEEQKRTMSDREVDLWESKARTGLMHRNDTISRLQSQLRSMATTAVQRSDGTEISLFQLGITTANDGVWIGRLEINETKLREALENDPNAIRDLFAGSPTMAGGTFEARNQRLWGIDGVGSDRGMGIAHRFDDIIRNTVDFGGSIYNRAGLVGTASAINNILNREMAEFDKRIEDMQKQLQRKENNYFLMFSRMENALAASNRQMDALYSSMMGGMM
jgi:flagellar hook-associated protein 2